MIVPEDLCESQLKELLAVCRLQSEQVLLTDGFGHTNAISASDNPRLKFVGPTYWLTITIDGVAV